MKVEIRNKLEKFFKTLNLSFEVMDYIYLDEIEEGITFDSLTDQLVETSVFTKEFIYSEDAIKYLSEHDNTLKESLYLAKEFGYSIDKIDSVLLATILAGEILEREWFSLQNEIEEFLGELFKDEKINK